MVLRVLHLVGSAVSEFYCDLSRLYAQDCLVATANPALYEFYIAYITPDRQWRFPSDLSREAIALASPVSVVEAVGTLAALQIDVMVPQMFCLPGMTYYRSLFDLLGIPYLGNSPDVMALTANKARAKAVVAAAGVSVPSGELLRAGDRSSIAPPVVIKPVNADNSLGVALVTNRAGYQSAIETAFTYADEVLVESFIELGREVRCGILVRDGELICLPLEEYRMDAEHQPIRRYDDKLAQNPNGDLYMVAKGGTKAWIVDRHDPITARVWEAAKKCHLALGCRHYSLFDFRIDPSGQPWFLEAGLYCSFASKSVIAMMAAAADIPVEKLFHIALRSCNTTNSLRC
jgi:D-alanine-D-alanine ligase